ncbi:OmpA family protein [Myxococcaceae bacterium GXIMD 01537]
MLAVALSLALGAGPPEPHPFVKPYEGSEVAQGLDTQQFGQVEFMLPGPGGKGLVTKPLEGQVQTVSYRGPKERSALEVFRNYQQALERAGYQVLIACAAEQCGGGVRSKVFGYLSARGSYYLAAKGTSEGRDIHVGLRVFERQALVVSVQAAAMEADKVQVTAAQLQEGLESTGHIALYGILFDTGKAELKPASDPVLKEIAALLRTRPALRLHVVGHTDNVGAFDSNLDLSRRRAEAVVKALVDGHSIPAARLRAFGASSAVPVASNGSEPGRAKNRRVELVEQ